MKNSCKLAKENLLILSYSQYKIESKVLRINVERFTNTVIGFENVSRTSTRESVDSIITLKVAQSKEELAI